MVEDYTHKYHFSLFQFYCGYHQVFRLSPGLSRQFIIRRIQGEGQEKDPKNLVMWAEQEGQTRSSLVLLGLAARIRPLGLGVVQHWLGTKHTSHKSLFGPLK